MLIQEVISYIEEKIPVSLKEDFDNIGLLVGESNNSCTGILITLDVQSISIQEAIQKNCNLIISHHPVIFKGLKSLTDHDETSKLIIEALRNHISIYALHTNLDNSPIGVSTILAKKIGLEAIRILTPAKGNLKKLITFCPKNYQTKIREALFAAGAGTIGKYDQCSFNVEGFGTFRGSDESNPFLGEKGKLHTEQETRIEVIYESYNEVYIINALLKAHPYEEVAYDCYTLTNKGGLSGAGAIGELKIKMPVHDFLNELRSILQIPYLRHSRILPPQVQRIAVCGGSGSFLIPDAVRAKADLMITSDIKYHEFQLSNSDMGIIDGGHFETEQFCLEQIQSLISEKFSTFATLISEHKSNLIGYF